MTPTLHPGELIVIQKISKNYKPGDIVVTDTSNTLGENLIKRVIAVEGDSVFISEKGIIYINGIKIEEQLDNSIVGDIKYPYTVPENHVFLMGDNRNGSTDSRFKILGTVDKENILGEMILSLNGFMYK